MKDEKCYADFHDGRNDHNCVGESCQWYQEDCIMLTPDEKFTDPELIERFEELQ